MKAHRIVVMRALQLGDLLVAVPAFRALRARFPDAEITLIGLPWAREFVQRYQHYIDRFVEFPGYPGLPEREFDEMRLNDFLRQQREYGYDIAIQMHGSGRTSNAFVQSLGAAATVGYYPSDTLGDRQRHALPYVGGQGRCPVRVGHTTRLPYADGEVPRIVEDEELTFGLPYPEGQAEILRNLALVALLDGSTGSTELEFPLTPEDDAEIMALLPDLTARGQRPWVALHPGSRSPARRWPAEFFARVADTLAHEWNAQIVFTGSTDEVITVQDVMRRMREPAINLAGRTSLGALAALMQRLHLFISNDTGPAHIACAVNCTSITLFGPAEFSRWAPLDQTRHAALRHSVECSPCGYWECPIDHRCLRGLTPEMVLNVAQSFVVGRGTV